MKSKITYILILILLILNSSCSFNNSCNLNKENNTKQDTFSYRKIEVKGNFFLEALTTLKDNMYLKNGCDQFDYIRVLYNDSNKLLGLVPNQISNLIFDYQINDMMKDSSVNYIENPIFLIFEVNGILFQINKVDAEKLNLGYILLKDKFFFDKKKWKIVKSEKCKKSIRNEYLDYKPFLIFSLEKNEIHKLNFKTKEGEVLGVTWHDLALQF